MLDFATKSFANIITLFNILFGSLSIIYTINQSYSLAAIFILIAVILDGLDGKIARRLDTESELGKQLDSLCDLVSFGVAPAVLIYAHIYSSHPAEILGLLATLLFIMTGAFRLARFNVLNIKGYFQGIPITMAGGIMALVSIISPILPFFLVWIVMILFSYLMISKIRIPKW